MYHYGKTPVAWASPVLMATHKSKQVDSSSEGRVLLVREVVAGQWYIHQRPNVHVSYQICCLGSC